MKNTVLLWVCCIMSLLLFSVRVSGKAANDPRRQRAEAILGNKSYYSGVGYGENADEARRQSIENLCRNISMTVSSSTESEDTEDSESFTSRAGISTFVTLNNAESYDVNTTPGQWEIITYIEKQQVASDMELRKDRIRSLVRQGLDLEKRLEIASALKYFNWAYAMSRTFTTPVMLEIDGINHDAKTWLMAHINNIFSNLEFSLASTDHQPNDLDPYVVYLQVNYLGQPVADLDFSYVNNGNRIKDQHVKNGRATITFERIPADHIDLSVYYKYDNEAKQFDPVELKTIYETRQAPTFRKSDIKIECKGSTLEKLKISGVKRSKEDRKAQEEYEKVAPSVVSAPKKRVETQMATVGASKTILESLRLIHKAISEKTYDSVRSLFTDEGYSLFSMMMRSGRVKTTNPNSASYTAEVAGDYIIGKSIPVSIRYNGGHTVSENIVFRFNADNKIESIAYALTQRAEDDIFKQNSWGIGARYAILHFMEDYQTAYALKNIDYISKIFSDDAVIISGKKNNNASVSKRDGAKYFITDSYTYKRETKNEFINRLKSEFPHKKYIKLTFEDNEIKEQSGLYNNIFWIEIKQFYSSSNYNDVGYLTLMIDMREADPVIKVRTWAPGKIPLQDLMKRYTID